MKSESPKKPLWKAYIWIVGSAFIGYIIWLLEATVTGFLGGSFIEHLLYAPAFALLSALVITIYSGAIQFVAGKLGGRGSFSELLNSMAPFFTLLLLLTCLLSGGMYIIYLFPLFFLPGLIILAVIKSQAINQFGQQPAIVSTVGGIMVFLGVTCILSVCVSTTVFGTPFCAFLGGY